jgi:hypothetical protein
MIFDLPTQIRHDTVIRSIVDMLAHRERDIFRWVVGLRGDAARVAAAVLRRNFKACAGSAGREWARRHGDRGHRDRAVDVKE